MFSYQQTVQNALEQVSNSLVASQKDREFREQQELLTKAAQQTDQLSGVLYKNGGARNTSSAFELQRHVRARSREYCAASRQHRHDSQYYPRRPYHPRKRRGLALSSSGSSGVVGYEVVLKLGCLFRLV
jgi:hypothetical protein